MSDIDLDAWPVYPDGVEAVTLHWLPAEAIGVPVTCDGCGELITGNALGIPGQGIFHSACAPKDAL